MLDNIAGVEQKESHPRRKHLKNSTIMTVCIMTTQLFSLELPE